MPLAIREELWLFSAAEADSIEPQPDEPAEQVEIHEEHQLENPVVPEIEEIREIQYEESKEIEVCINFQSYALYGWALALAICNFIAALCIVLKRANGDRCFGN